MTLNLNKHNWPRVVLGDVARHVTDRVDPETSGLTRFLAGEHIGSQDLQIRTWGVIGEDPIGPMFYKRFKPGHVLYVSRRSYLRKTAVPDFEGICGEKTFVLETKSEAQLLQRFLPFALSAERFHEYAIRMSRGSVNPYLNWTDLAAYEFDLPAIDEQERLADLLWAAEQHQQSLSKKKRQVDRATEIRFSHLLKEGNWPLVPVSSLITAGPTNGKSAPANNEAKGVPTLSISAVRGGRIVGGSSVKHIDIPPESVQRFIIEDNDFLIVRGNGNKQLTGKGGLACGGLPEGCVYPDLLIRLKFDSKKILPEFAAVQWNAELTHGTLVKKAKSTNGIWKINGKDIKSHGLVTPPLDIQRSILDEMRTFQNASIATEGEAYRIAGIRATIHGSVFG